VIWKMSIRFSRGRRCGTNKGQQFHFAMVVEALRVWIKVTCDNVTTLVVQTALQITHPSLW
jgi:hypothetical protein